jgi:hypothetical protein
MAARPPAGAVVRDKRLCAGSFQTAPDKLNRKHIFDVGAAILF